MTIQQSGIPLRPSMVYGPAMRDLHRHLPIDDSLPELRLALAQGGTAVLVAPPGAGKTTRVPLALLNEDWAKGGRIILLEPRRLAARGAASRMAATLGEPVGETIGLRMRLERKVSTKTRIEVVTEGVFTRLILSDPELKGIAAILFDEFHERSLDADFGLALALDARAGLREDLRLLVMSATLDGARVAGLLGGAPVIESQGRAFPVETRYLGRDPARRITEDMTRAIERALAEETGSILAFLPGQGEIQAVARMLADKIHDPSVIVAPLYSAIDPAEQDRAIAPAKPGERKIVLATSIAETSLTIEGVRVVIDCGLSRVPRYEPDIGITRLDTVRVSRAAADQRRGRAGRLEPGICYRLWEEAATGALPAFSEPEIRSADLAPLVLDCALWGVADPTTLPFLDPPPAPAIKEAKALLFDLGALDESGHITEEGRRIQKLALPPRLAKMVIDAADRGAADVAARLAALIVERGLGGSDIDLSRRAERFAEDRSRRAEDARRLALHWAREAEMQAKRETIAKPSSLAALLALAYPERIAKARDGRGAFLLANGRGAVIEETETLARAPFLVVAELTGTAARSRILSALALDPAEIAEVAGTRIETVDDLRFDVASAALRARRLTRLGAITLAEQPRPVPRDGMSALVLAKGLAAQGLDRLPWTKAQKQVRDRINFLRKAFGTGADNPWPDLTDDALAKTVEDWLAPAIFGSVSLAEIDEAAMQSALDHLVPWDVKRRMEEQMPSHFEAPTGSRIAIDYTGAEGPVLAIRVQELYGLTEHPTIAGGRVPLVLHLLSPAYRPIQITRDLPGFWRGSWAAVRAEMKGRYPKHVWPEDPASATPTTRAKPRGT